MVKAAKRNTCSRNPLILHPLYGLPDIKTALFMRYSWKDGRPTKPFRKKWNKKLNNYQNDDHFMSLIEETSGEKYTGNIPI